MPHAGEKSTHLVVLGGKPHDAAVNDMLPVHVVDEFQNMKTEPVDDRTNLERVNRSSRHASQKRRGTYLTRRRQQIDQFLHRVRAVRVERDPDQVLRNRLADHVAQFVR